MSLHCQVEIVWKWNIWGKIFTRKNQTSAVGLSLSVPFPTDEFPARPKCMVRKRMLLSIVWLWNFSLWGKNRHISYALVWNINIMSWLYFVCRSVIVFFRVMSSWWKLQLGIYLRTFPVPCIFIYLFHFDFYFIQFSEGRLQFMVKIYIYTYIFRRNCFIMIICSFSVVLLDTYIISYHVNGNCKTTSKNKLREIRNTSFDAL